MSERNVGQYGTYHSEHGACPCVCTDYSPGRDAGDHRVVAATNAAGEAAGQGLTFSRWATVGTGQGEVTFG